MSAIDTVYHEVIGQIKGIPIYRLKEDAPEHHILNGFDGKNGDILLGGGSGESAAMRISMPEAIQWFTLNDQIDSSIQYVSDVMKTHWSNNQAYDFIHQYIKIGYQPQDCPIEVWLTEHIISFLLEKFPNEYTKYVGKLVYEDGEKVIEYDGSICSNPEKEWVEFAENWFKQMKK